MCSRCYHRAIGRRGMCPGCSRDRLLPGLDPDNQPICTDCAEIPRSFYCTRCGNEDHLFRHQMCVRCCVTDDLSILLDDGSGSLRQELTPFYEAVIEQPRPMSAIIWLRNEHVRRVLRSLAHGESPIEHETFDSYGDYAKIKHLHQLLTKLGVLEYRDPNLQIYTRWLERTMDACDLNDKHTKVVRQYARWHHLRRLRELSDKKILREGHVRTSKQDTTVAINFLDWLEKRSLSLSRCRQAHVDEWFATGNTTRTRVKSFMKWSLRNGYVSRIDLPASTVFRSPDIDQDKRLNLMAELLDNKQIPLSCRTAAILFLLYGQPVTRLVRLTLNDITVKEDVIEILFGDHPVQVPHPFDEILRIYVQSRPNINTAGNADSSYLFAGICPDQPLSANYLMNQMRKHGVELRAMKAATIRDLVLEMPAVVAARTLGFKTASMEAHAARAGMTWASYPALHRSGRENS